MTASGYARHDLPLRCAPKEDAIALPRRRPHSRRQPDLGWGNKIESDVLACGKREPPLHRYDTIDYQGRIPMGWPTKAPVPPLR
jgi:hypothetical protein